MNRAVEAGNFIPQVTAQEGGSGRPITLMERLEQVAIEHPDFYSPESVARVRQFVVFETENPHKNKPFRLFKDFTDFELYYKLHPQWQGKSRVDMSNGVDSDASAFYQAFRKWIFRTTQGNKQQAKELRRRLFPPLLQDWSHLTTLDYWKEVLSQHLEWGAQSIRQLRRQHDLEGASFREGFNRWVKTQAGNDRNKANELRKSLRPPTKKEWGHLQTIEDWEQEWQKHPQWHGRTATDMRNDPDSGAATFNVVFVRWAGKMAQGDEQKRKLLVARLFPYTRKEWSSFKTLEDWVAEFRRHLNWQGLSPAQMLHAREEGAQTFYALFSRWARQDAQGDEKKRRQLMLHIFPMTGINFPLLLTIEDWQQELNRHPQWKEKSPSELARGEDLLARKFYASFIHWTKRSARNQQELHALREGLFPNNKTVEHAVSAEEARAELMKLVEEE